jgi:hypothetical protein
VTGAATLPGYWPEGPLRTVTNEDGFYRFDGLSKGNYAVYELQPPDLVDGIDTPGTTWGIAVNPQVAGGLDPSVEDAIRSLVAPPRDDAILRIALPPGTRSEENNFSELRVDHRPLFAVPELPPALPVSPARPVDRPGLIASTPRRLPPWLPRDFSFGHAGGLVQAHTWHLSVIDGGQPRTAAARSEPAWTQVSLPESHWQRVAHGVSRWLVVGPDDPGPEWVYGVVDAVPVAGDFNGDGLTEIGVYHDGHWFLDVNGNQRWDQGDLWARLGHQDDQPVTGDWDGDGKDDIGIFGRAWPGDPRAVVREPGLPDKDNRTASAEPKNVPPRAEDAALPRRVMKLTAHGQPRADVIDHVLVYGTAGDFAVAGDWNGDGVDTVGVFRDGNWKLDVDGTGRWSSRDLAVDFGSQGDLPVVGDFDGDGVDDLGVYRRGVFLLDSNGNRRLDAGDRAIRATLDEDAVPVVGDWNGDGIDQVGLYLPSGRAIVAARSVPLTE